MYTKGNLIMDTKTTLSISQARTKIFDLAEEVQTPGRVYTFTDKGVPKVVMLSAEEYESLLETLEVMSIFPKLDRDIKAARRDFKKGNYITLDQYLKKSKTKHEVPGNLAKKSPKRLGKNR